MCIIFLILFSVLQFNRITIDSGYYYHGVWAGNINGDGKIDILATRQVNDAGAIWFEQTANINVWNFHWIYQGGLNPMEIASANFDVDGDVDVVFNDYGLDTIRIGWNNGSGSFSITNISLTNPRQIRICDMDMDGDYDFVVGHQGISSPVHWFKNTGGTFTSYNVGSINIDNAWKIDVFDANMDGHYEVITSGSYVYWFQNDGNEVFTHSLVATLTGAAGVRVANFNGDMLYDVAVCEDVASGRLIWFENTGSGFTPHILQTIDYWDGLDVGDIDLDDDIDIVACYYGSDIMASQDGGIRLYLNDGLGNFTEQIIDESDIYDGDLPYIVDIDKDSCPDIIMTDNNSNGHLILYHQICGPSVDEKVKVALSPIRIKISNTVSFALNIEKGGFYSLKVYDLCGKLVYNYRNYFLPGNYSLEINLNSGVYFYNFNNLYGKFIVIR